MTIIRSRREWTSTGEGFQYPLKSGLVIGTAFHYPAMGEVTVSGRGDSYARQLLRNFRAYHVNTRGWPDIGYNLAISQEGSAWWAAGKRKAAHCASKAYPLANAHHFGIVLLLGNHEMPTDAMRKTASRVLDEIQLSFPKVKNKIVPHRGVYGAQTTCAGDVVSNLITSGRFLMPFDGPGLPPGPPVKNSNAHRSYVAGEVTKIQNILTYLGYYVGAIDDNYGPWTEAAVKKYQSAQRFPKIVADGDWGPVTQAHYEWVIRLQSEMNKWRGNEIRVDGDYGRITHNRVIDIQTRNHGGAYKGVLDGIPGPIFCGMLGIPTHP